MGSEEDEIKSKQASKKVRTLSSFFKLSIRSVKKTFIALPDKSNGSFVVYIIQNYHYQNTVIR
jgi:hypothetical protein